MAIDDGGHRPHGTHFGEPPRFNITHGPASLNVTLDIWGPQDNLFPAMYDALQANWSDAPSRTAEGHEIFDQSHMDGALFRRETRWGWNKLAPGQQAYIAKAFKGGTLSQVLEMLTFTFTVDGVTRAFTHEFVRARIGAGFMQHGGRDNDWRHRDWTMPETIWRACQRPEDLAATGKQSCISDWKPIHKLIEEAMMLGAGWEPKLEDIIRDYLRRGKELYAALVDAGIPWQDARRLLHIGTQTYIHGIFNFVALRGLLANRLEHIMDWEINCIAQLMLREIKMKCPAVIAGSLGSHSDLIGRAAFAMLDSWPPDGKYAANFPCECGHSHANHNVALPYDYCEVCRRDHKSCRGYRPVPPKTQHRAVQNPFWVLTKSAMAGGPVEWIWTNGQFPHDRY